MMKSSLVVVVILASFFSFLPLARAPSYNTSMFSFSLDQAVYAVNESDGAVEICVSGEPTGALLQLYFVNGSATMNEDYIAPGMVVTLQLTNSSDADSVGSGMSSSVVPVSTPRPQLLAPVDLGQKCVSVVIVDDGIAEPTESFTVILDSSSPSSVAIGTNVAEVHILDNDVVVIGLEEQEYTVTEGEDVVVCVRVEEGGALESVPFDFIIRSQPDTPLSATPSFDYIISVGEYPFLPDLSETCQNITIIDDDITEPVETFRVEVVHQNEELDYVQMSPGSAVVSIIDNDFVMVSMSSAVYTTSETAGQVEVCVTLVEGELSGVPAAVLLYTESGTALQNNDYVAVMSQLTFDPVSQPPSEQCQSITIINDGILEGPEVFTVSLEAISDFVEVGPPSLSTITIDDQFTADDVTDVISGDPLFTVPIYPASGSPLTSPLSLCYQIHGDADTYYNVISTNHTSVNGLWSGVTPTLNLLTEISVQAISLTGECYRILVELVECTVSINGESFSNSDTVLLNSTEGGVFVGRENDSVVVIRVPDDRGDGEGLRLEVECQTRRVYDRDGAAERSLLLLRVTRKLTPSGGLAHGLLGQLYHRTIDVQPFSCPACSSNTSYYNLTVPQRDGEPEREFHGRLYNLDWGRQETPCLYAGDSQGGAGGGERSGSVIYGLYRDYAVNSSFSEEGYQFGQFNSDSCT